MIGLKNNLLVLQPVLHSHSTRENLETEDAVRI